MFARRIILLSAIALMFAVPTAKASFDPPWLTPPIPRVGESASVNISGGICDVFVEWPGYPQVTRNGNAVRIVTYGNHETFDDFCIYGLWTVTEPIGFFEAGDYTLTTDFAYDDPLYGPTIITLGVVPFSVVGATPAAPVPTLDRPVVIVLSLLVSILGLLALPTLRCRNSRRLAHRVCLLPAIALMLVAQPAMAFFDPPWITPSEPQSGDTVYLNIRGGICDSIFEHPGYPQITQQGNAIRIVEYGHHWDTTDLCVYPVGTLTVPIGAYPSGSYTLTVDFAYDDFLYGPTILRLGVVPFGVVGATPAAPVPTLDRPVAIVLSLLVSILGLLALPTPRYRNPRPLAHRVFLLPAIALMLVAQPAMAFFDPPWITPVSPRAGEVVSVNIRDGVCDAIFFRSGYPQITTQGNAIRLIEYGHHWDTEDLCVYEIGHLVEPIGTYPPGNYTVTVDFAYDDPLYGPTIITLGVVPFSVVGATHAAPVPTLDRHGLLALWLLVSGIALWTVLQIHRRNHR